MDATFDTSLPILVNTVIKAWGPDAFQKNLVLRDAVGRLSLIVIDREKTGEDREAISGLINVSLGSYVDIDGFSAATPEELFDPSLRSIDALITPISTELFEGFVNIVDRRVVGNDWLHAPSSAITSQDTPRLFFLSLKGGVGRSTALCVLAAHLARKGQRVLAIDLDLEAPGLGSMLLDEMTTPEFGVLDYLVESGIQELRQEFYVDMHASSPLTGGQGVITVIPAFGKRSMTYPENVLGKIARAYLPKTNRDGHQITFSASIDALIQKMTQNGEYDAILVDARAGLHETTAAAAVGVKGSTLVFGIDQPQTYAGYKALFAQIALTLGDSWAERIHLVEARVGQNGPSDSFVDEMLSAMPSSKSFYVNDAIPLRELRNVFTLEWESDKSTALPSDEFFESSMQNTYIYESALFSLFDPFKIKNVLDNEVASTPFGHFIETCESILKSQAIDYGVSVNAGD